MKKTFVTLPRFQTTQSIATTLSNLMLNIEDTIGNQNISGVLFDQQINRLSVQSAKTKETIIIPRVETSTESGTTQIALKPLYPVKAIDLCNALNQAMEYLKYVHQNDSMVQILRLDASESEFAVYLDKEVNLASVTITEPYNESSFGVKVDLFDFGGDLFDSENTVLEDTVSDESSKDVIDEEPTTLIEKSDCSSETTEIVEPVEIIQIEDTSSSELETSENNDSTTEELSSSEIVEEEQTRQIEVVETITKDETDEEMIGEEVKETPTPSIEEPLRITQESNSENIESVKDETPLIVSTKEVVQEVSSESLMLIDGNNLLLRGYFATAHSVEDEEDLQKDKDGNFVNAIKLFVQQLERLLRTYSPTRLCIAFDNNNPFLENIRKRFYPPYKATRDDKPASLMQQLDSIADVLRQMNVPFIMDQKGLYEADDIIGTLVMEWRNQNKGTIYIVSNDKDLYQLLNDQNTFQIAKKGSDEVVYSMKDFENEYGVFTNQWVDVKAILGDKSDNIPGVSGVGEKYVYDMLKQYQTVENLYEHLNDMLENSAYKRYVPKFETQKKEAMLSKFLATIITNAPVEGIQKLNMNDLSISINEEGRAAVYERVGLNI